MEGGRLDKTLDEIIKGEAKARKAGGETAQPKKPQAKGAQPQQSLKAWMDEDLEEPPLTSTAVRRQRRQAAASRRAVAESLRESLSQKGRVGPYSLYPAGTKGQAAPAPRRRKAAAADQGWLGYGAEAAEGLNGATLVGVVKSWSPRDGWGFLACEAITSRDVFIHLSDCDESIGQLQVGDEVEFELAFTNEHQLRAVDGRLLEPADWQAYFEPGGSAGSSYDEWWDTPRRGPAAVSSSRDEWDHSRGEPALQSTGSRNRGRGKPGGGQQGAGTRVRVMNFPWTLTTQALWDAFEEVGDVLHVHLDESHVGQAVVTFGRPAAARRAVEEYHRGAINGREILVRYED